MAFLAYKEECHTEANNNKKKNQTKQDKAMTCMHVIKGDEIGLFSICTCHFGKG